jgi:hypothetical protein
VSVNMVVHIVTTGLSFPNRKLGIMHGHMFAHKLNFVT